MINVENWLDIPDWNKYKISQNGEVFSKKRNKLLSVYFAENKYPRVSLCNGKQEKTFCVHRLVALAYIPNPDNKRAVNHKDGNKHNNNVSNLEWVTWSENQKHAVLNGLAIVPNLGYGENHPASKLNNVDVAMIKVLLDNGFNTEQIAKRFNVHQTHISAIKLNKTWKQVN